MGILSGEDFFYSSPKHRPTETPLQPRPPVRPAISFQPKYLADALVIGSTLRLIDGISPGVASDPASGNYCLIMPCRLTEEVEEAAESPVPVIAA